MYNVVGVWPFRTSDPATSTILNYKWFMVIIGGCGMNKFLALVCTVLLGLCVAGCAGKAPIVGKGKAPVVQTKG
jgi:hypothetical protein